LLVFDNGKEFTVRAATVHAAGLSPGLRRAGVREKAEAQEQEALTRWHSLDSLHRDSFPRLPVAKHTPLPARAIAGAAGRDRRQSGCRPRRP
jgi:hypothetical protein